MNEISSRTMCVGYPLCCSGDFRVFPSKDMGILFNVQGFCIKEVPHQCDSRAGICQHEKYFHPLNALNSQFWPALSTFPCKRRVDPDRFIAGEDTPALSSSR